MRKKLTRLFAMCFALCMVLSPLKVFADASGNTKVISYEGAFDYEDYYAVEANKYKNGNYGTTDNDVTSRSPQLSGDEMYPDISGSYSPDTTKFNPDTLCEKVTITSKGINTSAVDSFMATLDTFPNDLTQGDDELLTTRIDQCLFKWGYRKSSAVMGTTAEIHFLASNFDDFVAYLAKHTDGKIFRVPSDEEYSTYFETSLMGRRAFVTTEDIAPFESLNVRDGYSHTTGNNKECYDGTLKGFVLLEDIGEVPGCVVLGFHVTFDAKTVLADPSALENNLNTMSKDLRIFFEQVIGGNYTIIREEVTPLTTKSNDSSTVLGATNQDENRDNKEDNPEEIPEEEGVRPAAAVAVGVVAILAGAFGGIGGLMAALGGNMAGVLSGFVPAGFDMGSVDWSVFGDEFEDFMEDELNQPPLEEGEDPPWKNGEDDVYIDEDGDLIRLNPVTGEREIYTSNGDGTYKDNYGNNLTADHIAEYNRFYKRNPQELEYQRQDRENVQDMLEKERKELDKLRTEREKEYQENKVHEEQFNREYNKMKAVRDKLINSSDHHEVDMASHMTSVLKRGREQGEFTDYDKEVFKSAYGNLLEGNTLREDDLEDFEESFVGTVVEAGKLSGEQILKGEGVNGFLAKAGIAAAGGIWVEGAMEVGAALINTKEGVDAGADSAAGAVGAAISDLVIGEAIGRGAKLYSKTMNKHIGKILGNADEVVGKVAKTTSKKATQYGFDGIKDVKWGQKTYETFTNNSEKIKDIKETVGETIGESLGDEE